MRRAFASTIFEDHRERLPLERVAILLRFRLDVARKLEELADLVRGVVGISMKSLCGIGRVF